MSDDALLLRRYAEDGSESAFTELVHRHVDLVYNAALRRSRGDVQIAADVVQLVFTRLARNAGKLARHPVLAAWLHTATRNAALNLMISEQRRQVRETAALHLTTTNASGNDNPDWDRLKPVLDAAIDELPEPDRAAVIMRFLERRPFATIGTVLQVSEDSARMRTNRALEKLRLVLARRGITSTTAALGLLVSSQPLLSAPAGLGTVVASQAIATIMTAKTVTSTTLVAAVLLGSGAYVAFRPDTSSPIPPPVEIQQLPPPAADPIVLAPPVQPAPLPQLPARAPVVINSFKELSSGIPAEGAAKISFSSRPAPSDPEEARKELRRINGESIDQRYGALYQQLGFSQEQIDRFRELELLTTEARNAIFRETFRTHPENTDRQQMQALLRTLVDDANAVFLDQVAREFGVEVAAKVRAYQANRFRTPE